MLETRIQTDRLTKARERFVPRGCWRHTAVATDAKLEERLAILDHATGEAS